MFEGVEAQGAERLRKLGKSKRVGFVVGDQRVPDDFRLHVHERGERAGFTDGRDQGGRINAKQVRFDGQVRAVGIEGAEYHVVGVEILGDAQHGGAGEFGRGGQAVALEFTRASGVGIDLFTGIGKILDGEFFESLAKPIEARG